MRVRQRDTVTCRSRASVALDRWLGTDFGIVKVAALKIEAKYQVACSPCYLSQLRHGRRTPGPDLALAIEHMTAGVVKVVAWRSPAPAKGVK